METMHGTNVQKEMRHIINLLCVCFVAFSMASCGGNSSSDKERIAQLEDSIARMQAKQFLQARGTSPPEPLLLPQARSMNLLMALLLISWERTR